MAKTFFWISVAGIIYTYAGYPVIIWLLARFYNRKVSKADVTPEVSIVIACLNEERRIGAKIQNLLELSYPADCLEIIIVSDGSTDRTLEEARRYESGRVRVYGYAERKGKPTALSLGVEQASGEIIVFADARQLFDPNAVKELVASFADPSVGAVAGAYVVKQRPGSTVGESLGLYWKYEEWIRKNEGRFNSVVGAPGAIYALRRKLWKPLPPTTINDDVYTPLNVALGGHRVVFEERARAYDFASETTGREFSRKVRTLMGNYQLCQLMPRLMLPTGLVHFQFHSHKLMRLVVPFLLLTLLATSAAMAFGPVEGDWGFLYRAALALQSIFYAGVLAGGYLMKRNRKIKLLNFPYVFSVMNFAALVGLIYFIRGKRNVWMRGE